MTALTGKKPKDTYRDLLQVSNANKGIDESLRPIEDGEGTRSALSLSTAQVSLAGNELVLDRDGDTSIAAADDDRIDIKLAGAVDFRFRESAFDVLAGSTLTLKRGASLAVETDATVVGLSVVPTGMVAPFAGAAAPEGWLFCAGQAVPRNTYARLFAAIGTAYGAGNRNSTFNLPDLRGRAVAGKDDMGGNAAGRLTGRGGGVDGATLGAAGGAERHVLRTHEIPRHVHGRGTLAATASGAHAHDLRNWRGGSLPPGGTEINSLQTAQDSNQEWRSDAVRSSGAHVHSITGNTASTGGGSTHNNVQPTAILNWIIKT